MEGRLRVKRLFLTGIAVLFLATGAAHAGKIVLRYEKGGSMQEHIDHYRAIANAGVDVEIRSRCISACTQIMTFVPNERICFDKRGTLEFHMVYYPKTMQPAPDWTELMFNHFPEDIRMWLKKKGWVQKATIENFWVLTAEDLWAMGYRKCEADGWPQ